MSAPIVAIRSALELALFGQDNAFPTAWENKEFTPVVGTPYQRVFFQPAKPQNPTMGSSHYREQGTLRIDLCYPAAGQGTRAAADRAELLRAVFKRGSTFTDSGIAVKIPSTPTVKPPRQIDGWLVLTIVVDFYADVFV